MMTTHLVSLVHFICFTKLTKQKKGKQIGKGNYSVVHEAFDKRTNERVAVKITDKTDLDEDDIREIKEEVGKTDLFNESEK